MEDYESTWSDWSQELPAELQQRNRHTEFPESLTTPESISTHFIVTKQYHYFEMEWDSHNGLRRWLEIDQEECKRRTKPTAHLRLGWYSAFPGHLGLIVDPMSRTVGRVGFDPVASLTEMEFDLFRIIFDANGRAEKNAIESRYEGKRTGLRQRKAELKNKLIPLNVTVDRRSRIVELDQNAS